MKKEWNIKFCIDYIDFYKFSVTGHKSKDILTDYEPCFIDRKYEHTKSRIQLRDEWIAASAHLPPIVDGIMQWKRVWPEEFYKYRFGVVDAEEKSGSKQIESSGE